MDHVNLLQQLMDTIADNIFFKDRAGKFIMINKANAEWFGLNDPQDAVGKDDFDFFTREHAEKQREEEQWIMNTGQPVLCEEQGNDRDGFPAGWGSVTKVPLRDKDGHIIGTMGIGRDISDLKNKELELKRANDQIAEDLRMAATVQQTLLPQSYPAFVNGQGCPLVQFCHLYKPDTELGGDFCSVYRLSDSRAGLFICDVMGHGVQAALITASIQATAEALVRNTTSPGDFMTAMNRRLAPILQTESQYMFATAAYCILDVNSGELAGSIAGHTLPFLIQSQQGKASLVSVKDNALGPALAIDAEYSYGSFSIRLNPGDKVLMYTDGICEALNAARQEFGLEHLRETLERYSKLPLEELVQRIVDVVQDYAGNERLGDDVCLLGLTVLGNTEQDCNAPAGP